MTDLKTDPALDQLAQLALDLDGTLVRPADPGWDEARLAWHLDVDQRPLAVVLAESARDVVAVVVAADSNGWRVAPQGTGHNAGPLGDLSDSILLKTSRMRGVHVDPAARTARVEAGALWEDVTGVAAEHGLAALAGSSPDVGVVGYTLGGGLSWLARSHGLASSSVTAVELVTADGQLRRVDTEHEPDLFWAVRGGGGSFGVVTALEFRLYPITDIHAGVLFFPIERTAEVLHTWHAWLPSVPEAVTSVGRVLRFPPLPDLPPHLSGQSYVVVEAACQLSEAEADELLAPLRALGPAIDTFETVAMPALSQLHMDPPAPVPGRGDGLLLRDVTSDGIAAFVRAAGPHADSPLLSLELRHLGGAVRPGAVADQGVGAVEGLDADFAFFAVGFTPTPEATSAVEAAVTAAQHALAPWSTGRVYLNFAERHKAGDALFGPEVHARLRRVKAVYDPAELIHSNHPVRPGGR
jgi:FAD/FMN-containing dehydrogenase